MTKKVSNPGFLRKKTVKMGAPDISRVLHSNLRKSQLPILAFGSS